MSQYTMEIYDLILMLTGQTDYADDAHLDTLISQVADMLFPPGTPYYNPDGLHEFAVKFLNNYLFHEICTVPWARWKRMLQARLAEIMPLYTALWKSETASEFQYKPLENVNTHYDGDKDRTEDTDFSHTASEDYVRDVVEQTGDERTSQGESSSTSSNTDASNSWGKARSDTSNLAGHEDGNKSKSNSGGSKTSKFSDTPQNNIPVETDGYGNIVMQYLTNITMDNTTDNNTSTSHGMANDKSRGVGGNADERHSGGASQGSSMGTQASSETHVSDKINGEDYGQNEEANDITDFDYHDDWRENRVGHEPSHSYQQLVKEWRDLIVEYDRRIMEDCHDLFMLIY